MGFSERLPESLLRNFRNNLDISLLFRKKQNNYDNELLVPSESKSNTFITFSLVFVCPSG